MRRVFLVAGIRDPRAVRGRIPRDETMSEDIMRKNGISWAAATHTRAATASARDR
jgi:hypothetical protein